MKSTLLLDGARGVYIPQIFAQMIETGQITGEVDPETLAVLKAGPDHEEYFEAWDELIWESLYYKDSEGQVFQIERNDEGDLFAVYPLPDECVIFTLPAHWASYLINGDDSGLSPKETEQVNAFLESETVGLTCTGLDDQEYFSHGNDATNLGGMVIDFHFMPV